MVLPADRPGVVGAFAGEWQRVFAIRGAFILLIGAPLIYGIYYPQPYLNQILRKLPIVVVDADQSELSRRIVETLDASGAVSVVTRARTLADARAAIDRGDAFAAVGIPPAPSATCSRASRLTFRSTPMPLTCFSSDRCRAALRSLSTRCRQSSPPAARARTAAWSRRRLAGASPADVLLQPIFNPVGGYASYIVPAAFLLILQQTLLVGAAFSPPSRSRSAAAGRWQVCSEEASRT